MKLKPIIKKGFLVFTVSCIAAGLAVILSSCAPTYPKEQINELVKNVFRIEYNMDVDIAVEGNTLGIYHPMKGLLDVGMGISQDAWDQISNLILVASRVVLSTDADIKFYCVITQDERLPEMQVIIIKYVDDVKRGMYRNISRNESFKRTLFSINLTPQAKKERSVEKVFDKLGLEEETRENVLSEFFRSPPTKLSDIGYWRRNFYLKDISLEEFLAAQIANRIKIEFRGEEDLNKDFKISYSEGMFNAGKDLRSIIVKFKIFDQKKPEEDRDLRRTKISRIIHIANEVIYGYKFKDFDILELDDQLANVKLWITSENVYDYNRDKLSLDNIVKTSGNYF